MFVGHFAPALVAAARPRAAGLGTLFIAAQIVDIGFAALLIPGIEAMRIVPGITAMNPMDLYHMPYTHSLLGTLLWAALFGALVGFATRRRAAALGAGLVVLSHWPLDLIVHIPDLTLFGAPPKLGLGLWNHPLIEMPLEIALTGGALLYYAARTRAPSGHLRLWVLGGATCADPGDRLVRPEGTDLFARHPRDDALRLCAARARRMVGGARPRAGGRKIGTVPI